MKKIIKYTTPRLRKNLVEITPRPESVELSFSIDEAGRNDWYEVFFRELLSVEVAREIGKALIDAAQAAE